MPRSTREIEAEIIANQGDPTREAIEARQEDEINPVVAGGAEGLANHELPPQMRDKPLPFTYEELIGRGLSDAVAVKIMKEILEKNGGLVEYDEEREAERIRKLRQQQHEIAVIDSGNSVQHQLSFMEKYFAGAVQRGSERDPAHLRGYCRRYPYISPQAEVVGINGYIFRIPAHKRVLLPEEVIDILEKAATATEKFNVLSAAYQARQFEPIYMRPDMLNMDAGQFAAQQVAGFPVREGVRRDGNGLTVNTTESIRG